MTTSTRGFLDCFKKLAGHDVAICNYRVQEVDTLAERLSDTPKSKGE